MIVLELLKTIITYLQTRDIHAIIVPFSMGVSWTIRLNIKVKGHPNYEALGGSVFRAPVVLGALVVLSAVSAADFFMMAFMGMFERWGLGCGMEEGGWEGRPRNPISLARNIMSHLHALGTATSRGTYTFGWSDGRTRLAPGTSESKLYVLCIWISVRVVICVQK